MEPNIYIYNELIVKIADVKTATNSGLAKVAVPCPPETLLTKEGQVVVHQTLILRIYPSAMRDGKITTFVKPQTVGSNFK